jgi:hypothetical protein
MEEKYLIRIKDGIKVGDVISACVGSWKLYEGMQFDGWKEASFYSECNGVVIYEQANGYYYPDVMVDAVPSASVQCRNLITDYAYKYSLTSTEISRLKRVLPQAVFFTDVNIVLDYILEEQHFLFNLKSDASKDSDGILKYRYYAVIFGFPWRNDLEEYSTPYFNSVSALKHDVLDKLLSYIEDMFGMEGINT